MALFDSVFDCCMVASKVSCHRKRSNYKTHFRHQRQNPGGGGPGGGGGGSGGQTGGGSGGGSGSGISGTGFTSREGDITDVFDPWPINPVRLNPHGGGGGGAGEFGGSGGHTYIPPIATCTLCGPGGFNDPNFIPPIIPPPNQPPAQAPFLPIFSQQRYFTEFGEKLEIPIKKKFRKPEEEESFAPPGLTREERNILVKVPGGFEQTENLKNIREGSLRAPENIVDDLFGLINRLLGN